MIFSRSRLPHLATAIPCRVPGRELRGYPCKLRPTTFSGYRRNHRC